MRRPLRDLPPRWHTGPLERPGIYGYVHLVRHPDDPQRSGSELQEGRAWGVAPERRIASVSVRDWAVRIMALLDDGRARTFNHLAVVLCDLTADVAFDSNLDRALWALVESRHVEHDGTAPVLFRRRRS